MFSGTRMSKSQAKFVVVCENGYHHLMDRIGDVPDCFVALFLGEF